MSLEDKCPLREKANVLVHGSIFVQNLPSFLQGGDMVHSGKIVFPSLCKKDSHLFHSLCR